MLRSYLKYLYHCKGQFRIHSPFVFNYVTKALKYSRNDDFDKLYSVYRLIDKHRFCPKYKRHKIQILYKTTQYFQTHKIFVMGETDAANIASIALSLHEAEIHTTSWHDKYDELESMGTNNIIHTQKEDIIRLLNDDERDNITLFLSSPDNANDIIPLLGQDDIIIADKIHSNRNNEDLWEILKDNKHVSFDFDLYHIGILFFKKGFEKQDFILKY